MRFALTPLGALFVLPLLLLACGGSDGTDAGPVDRGLAFDAGESGAFLVRFETTAGEFVVVGRPDWAPLAAARFREMAEADFFVGNKFFQVTSNPAIAQFGYAANPDDNDNFNFIVDEPRTQQNLRGRLAMAPEMSVANTRSTLMYVNRGDNPGFDQAGFAPFGEIMTGLDAIDAINGQYGDTVDTDRVRAEGDAYLDADFPDLDEITGVEVL